jgi:hypothetical protein
MDQLNKNLLQGELAPGEKLLWSGQPAQGFQLHAGDAMAIPCSILWFFFAVYWELTILQMGADTLYALFGVPFILLGLYLLVGRFGVDIVRRQKTVYGVTPERVIIISGVLTQNTKSLNMGSLSDVSLTVRGSGTGTIIFGSVPSWYWWQRSFTWPGYVSQLVPTFDLIPDAREVYNIVRDAQREARGVHDEQTEHTEQSEHELEHEPAIGVGA